MPATESADADTLPVVAVWAAEPLTAEGLTAMLRIEGVELVPLKDMAVADVVVIAGRSVDPRAVDVLNQVHQRSPARVVLVVDELTDADLRLAATRPVRRIVACSTVTRAALVEAVRAESALPRLADQVERVRSDRLRPRGATRTGLTGREQEVLRLLAQGCATVDIAQRLAYSERTVKNIVRVILDRLSSANRAHAVAFATREGII